MNPSDIYEKSTSEVRPSGGANPDLRVWVVCVTFALTRIRSLRNIAFSCISGPLVPLKRRFAFALRRLVRLVPHALHLAGTLWWTIVFNLGVEAWFDHIGWFGMASPTTSTNPS